MAAGIWKVWGAILIFYLMFNISLIRTVEGAKVSPTSLENPALRVLSQIHSSNLQFHLFRQNWIDLWSFGGQRFHSGWLVWTEGTEEPDRGCNTGRWYSCGEEREHNPENVRDKEWGHSCDINLHLFIIPCSAAYVPGWTPQTKLFLLFYI